MLAPVDNRCATRFGRRSSARGAHTLFALCLGLLLAACSHTPSASAEETGGESAAVSGELQKSGRESLADEVPAPASAGAQATTTRPSAVEGEVASEERPTSPAVRRPTAWDADDSASGRGRVSAAYDAKQDVVDRLFSDAGVAFPPKELLFRVFKEEAELEVWARDRQHDAMVHITTYAICYMSGSAGPKRREGDAQVPEGFYTLDSYNKRSAYHLAMRVSYPNRSDRVLGDKPLGGAIMIHGSCVSIGCIAMSDERIQELWVMADKVRAQDKDVQVYVFPGRDLDGFVADAPNDELAGFWGNLREGNARFEEQHRLLRVHVDKTSGRYTFGEP